MVILDNVSQLRNLDLERNDRQYLTEQLEADPSCAVCDISGSLFMAHLVQPGEPHRTVGKGTRGR